MIIKGFFFDLDGTLVDTQEADFLAYRDAFLEVANLAITREDFARTNGQEMRDKVVSLVPKGMDSEQLLALANAKRRHYKKYLHLTSPNERLVKFIEQITHGAKIILVTSAKQQNAKSVLQAHGLLEIFDHMIFGEDVSHNKPHPEAYLLALRKSGLAAQEVVAFEDSEAGIASASEAGIAVIKIGKFL